VKRLLLSALAGAATFAQQLPVIQSPDVHNDGRVTFRYFDPGAQHVVVNLEGRKDPYVMEKDQQGIWSVTSDPLAPEIYGYSFTADRIHRLDPENTRIKPNLLTLNNLVLVPGPSPMPWEDTDIPHGTVHHHFYKSNVVGDNRDFYVYTPPGYDPNAKTLYPVLYLLHGYSDDARGWTAVGKANLILDTLIDQGKAKPMIVVMPLGYGAPEIVSRSSASGGFRNQDLRRRNFSNFQAALLDEVIPRVEQMYKVSTNRSAHAIAGLSMGGAESLLTGLNHLEEFSWIGGFSSGGLDQDLAGEFPKLSSADNTKIRLLWIACGTEDNLITPNRNLIGWLKGKGLKVTPIETPGMHTWMVWRADLLNFAPLLFQDRPDGNTGVQ